MKQKWLFEWVEERELRAQEKVVTTCEVNSAYSKATNYMKPDGAGIWAVAKAKGLRPEITSVSEADAVHLAEGRSLFGDNWRVKENLTGSDTTARYRKDYAGIRENQYIPVSVCNHKPMNGKVSQKTLWGSDKPIVAKKSRNGDRAKGLAVKLRADRDTSCAHRGGQRKSTKLLSLYLSIKARENPEIRFTSLVHMLTVDFLKECFSELNKDSCAGIEGIKVDEYQENLEDNLKALVERIKEKRYKPQPVKRVYMPKPRGGQRPIGISAVEDKIAQMGIKKILEAIYETDFLDVS